MRKTKNKLPLVCLCILLFYSIGVSAQQRSWTGQVWDESLNEPLIGATVSVKGTTLGIVTDSDGQFKIDAAVGQTLVFSYVGYLPVEILLSSNTNLARVPLKENVMVMDEVIVVGYGVQSKKSTVAAITQTTGEELLKVGSVTTVSEALQGQLPGVVAISSSAKPGADAADLFIRGKGTWGNASPMILVDGIERNFNDVDVNEIETISVLKDASATAVYGVRGANGVILITTKRGKESKPTINFSANFGFKQPSASPKWADYITALNMYNEAQINDKGWDKLRPESEILAWQHAIATGNYGPYNDVFPQVDWWNETVKSYGTQQTYNLNISGGTQKMKYFASVGYLYDGDIYKTQDHEDFDSSFNFKRYNWRSNFDFSVTPTTELSFNIAGKMGYRNQPAYRPNVDKPDSDSWFFKWYYQSPTNTFPIKYSDGQWGDSPAGGENIMVYLNETGANMYKTYQGFYDVNLNQKLDFVTKGLSLKGSLSYTSYSEWESNIMTGKIMNRDTFEAINTIVRYYRPYDYSSPITNPDGSISYPAMTPTRHPNDNIVGDYPLGGTYDVFSNSGRKLYYELALNYKNSFANHNVTALALFNRKQTEVNLKNSGVMQFPSYEQDWVGRITYNFDERYLLELNAAYTASEKFAPGKRYGFFPSYSVGWRLSEEEWLKKYTMKYLTNLKVRYSYGEVGNDLGAPRFNYIQTFTSGGNAQFGLDQDYNWGPIYSEGKLADINATWERATKQNIGIEIGLFNKLNLIIDLYDEKRKNILMVRNTVPSWLASSATLPAVNLGKTKNHGLEIEANWNDRIDKVNYYLKLNFATSENRIVYRDDPRNLPFYMKQEGKSIGFQSKYLATGNFQSLDDIFNSAQSAINNGLHDRLVPGDLYYIDFNGDGIIDINDQVPIAHLNYPLTTASFTIGGEWNGFGFNALFYTALNVYKEQISEYLWDFPANNIKVQPHVSDRWTPDKPVEEGPVRPSLHLNNNYNQVASTYTYTNHSYLRLKNMEVNYALPKNILGKLGVGRCQVYVNASNLFTISKADSRRDPETSGQDVYPLIRRYNFGFRLGF